MIECQDCQFWEYLYQNCGECRKARPFRTDDKGEAMWPLTKERWFCGEAELARRSRKERVQ